MESLNLDLGAEELREVDLDLDLSNDVSAININNNNDIKNIDLGSVNKPRPNLMVHDSNSNIGLDLLVNKSKLSKDENKKEDNSFSISNSVNNPSNEVSVEEFSISNLDTDDIAAKAEESPGGGFFNLSSSNNEPSLSNDINIDDTPLDLNNTDNLFNASEPAPPPKVREVPVPPKEMSFEEIQEEKFKLLCLLERLEKRGIKTIRSLACHQIMMK